MILELIGTMCALVSVPLAIGGDYSAACFFVGWAILISF